MEKGAPARHGAKILSDDKEIGVITSGCPSPSLGGNVAMGYVNNDFKAVGTKVTLLIRDRKFEATIAKMPFTRARYYNKLK